MSDDRKDGHQDVEVSLGRRVEEIKLIAEYPNTYGLNRYSGTIRFSKDFCYYRCYMEHGRQDMGATFKEKIHFSYYRSRGVRFMTGGCASVLMGLLTHIQ